MELLAKILSAGNALLCLFLVVKAVITLKTLGSFPRTSRRPFVSILVPARNEEANIEACVKSLLAQDYPDFELIVLDDESEDATWSILCHLAAQDKRLRIIKGKELPAGWVGKSWACHQLSRAAQENICFLSMPIPGTRPPCWAPPWTPPFITMPPWLRPCPGSGQNR